MHTAPRHECLVPIVCLRMFPMSVFTCFRCRLLMKHPFARRGGAAQVQSSAGGGGGAAPGGTSGSRRRLLVFRRWRWRRGAVGGGVRDGGGKQRHGGSARGGGGGTGAEATGEGQEERAQVRGFVERYARTRHRSELELELIQYHMAQKPVLRGEVGCACVAREVSVERGDMGQKPVLICC